MIDRVVTISTKANGGIKSVVENYERCGLFNGIEHVWICTHVESSFLNRQILFFTSLFHILVARIKGTKIFHIHMAMKGSFYRKLIVTLLLKISLAKVVLHLHGSEFKDFYSKSSLKPLIRYLFNTADRVIVLSESWKDFVSGIALRANVVVVNNYVDEIIKTDTAESNDFTFLFLGAIGPRKGVFDLLTAFNKLYEENKNITLLIAGNDDKNILPEKISSLPCSSKIKFFGWINYQEKSELLNRADCLVLPSYNEGLPMVILEAMSAKVAVISSTVGGIPEVISNGNNGYTISPGNIDGLVECMQNIQSDDIRHNFVTNSYALYRERFSPDTIIPKLAKIYSEVDNES